MDSNKDCFLGYKAFNKGLRNIFGKKFEVGKKYKAKDEHLSYGYHYCKYLEDVFVYYKGDNLEICEVLGSSDTITYNNDYYGIYEIYASAEIEILRKISREEIIDYFLNMSLIASFRVVNFVSRVKLTDEEILLFLDKYRDCGDVVDAIKYYQLDINVYEEKLRKKNL